MYLGVIIGTVLFNMNILSGGNRVLYQGTFEEYLKLLFIRSIEMFVVLLIADKLYFVWDIIAPFVVGAIMGVLLSSHTLMTNIWNQLIFSILLSFVLILYLEIFSLNKIPGGLIDIDFDNLSHGYILRYILVVTILLINAYVELKIMKFF